MHSTQNSQHITPLLVIGGPTATGKTDFAVDLARRYNAELVGADSMQVYRRLNIGTAKPTAEELEDVPHWLIDVVDPHESFDAASFVDEADRVIADIAARGKQVIVVGGTGLYIRTLLRGVHGGPAANPEFRAEVGGRAAVVGWPAIHRELAEVDPASAQRLHPNDRVRILRALEVFHLSGKTMSDWQREHGFAKARYPYRYLALERPREQLRERIALRVDRMMDDGFLDEVRGLLADGFESSLKPMQGLGYKRLCQHLEGELSLSDAIGKIKTDTSRFAKRQMTWFKGEQDVVWVPCHRGAVEEQAAQWFARQPGSEQNI